MLMFVKDIVLKLLEEKKFPIADQCSSMKMYGEKMDSIQECHWGQGWEWRYGCVIPHNSVAI